MIKEKSLDFYNNNFMMIPFLKLKLNTHLYGSIILSKYMLLLFGKSLWYIPFWKQKKNSNFFPVLYTLHSRKKCVISLFHFYKKNIQYYINCDDLSKYDSVV